MIYRRLGRTGLKISALGLGSWNTFGEFVSDRREIDSIYRRAFEAGIRLFDSAATYGRGEAEQIMGEALKPFPRHHLVLSTKAFFAESDDPNDRGLSRKHLFHAVEQSLKRLGTDYLDLFFCHRFDRETPIQETERALDDLVRQGKILYWGTSEWRSDHIGRVHRSARRAGRYAPVCEQAELSLLKQLKYRWDTAPATRRRGMGVLAFSPLASGLLSGKYDRGIDDDSRFARLDWTHKITQQLRDQSQQFEVLARQLGVTRSQLAIAWAMSRPGVSSVLLGASRLEQLEENLGALDVELTRETESVLQRLFAPSPQRIARYLLGQKVRWGMEVLGRPMDDY
jgi:voltage-dependent potassium channel beta subunit